MTAATARSRSGTGSWRSTQVPADADGPEVSASPPTASIAANEYVPQRGTMQICAS